jgi:hypothetical protein
VAYCTTNIYSVGTPHEIILCRQEHKPVLFVSPRISFPTLDALKQHLTATGDEQALGLLAQLEGEVPIKPNPAGSPSLWYMPLVGGDTFFDGFGFAAYRKLFGWPEIPLDGHEQENEPKRPLLPYLEQLNARLPTRWEDGTEVANDDWILWDLKRDPQPGAEANAVHSSGG